VLRSIHQSGGFHGDVRPTNLLVGPLTVKTDHEGVERRRPAPDAVVRLAEIGLVPLRPPAAECPPDRAVLPYLPPERIDGAVFGPAGDLYGLGASLYFLLSGRPPFEGEDLADLQDRIRSQSPTPIATIRPDLPPELAALVDRMLEKDPTHRPATAYDVESALVPLCRPGTVPAQSLPQELPVAAPASGAGDGEAVPEAVDAEESSDGWGVDPAAFSLAGEGPAATPPRRRESTAGERARTRMLVLLGGILHLTGVCLLIAWALGAFKSTPHAEPDPATQKGDEPGKFPKKQRSAPGT
jgi:serine/threonine protein kinase